MNLPTKQVKEEEDDEDEDEEEKEKEKNRVEERIRKEKEAEKDDVDPGFTRLIAPPDYVNFYTNDLKSNRSKTRRFKYNFNKTKIEFIY